MAKIKYVDRKFSAASKSIIETAEEICDEYANDNLVITLRQLYYQFVARGHLANTQENYKRLGSIINDARLAGLIDWKHLEDRTRNLQSNSHWSSPQAILSSCAYSFRLDKWATQKHHVEVWVEKEALAGIVERAARGLDVSFFSCRGYVSQSEMHSAALRFKHYNKMGQAVRVVHLGDHDPSGIDMTRDIADRMEVFGVKDVRVNRIALNMDQVRQYNPPPNPAKATDARFTDYLSKYGDESWELDALEPRILEELIHREVSQYCDDEAYGALEKKEETMRGALRACHDRWPAVAAFLDVPEAGEAVRAVEYEEDENEGKCTFPDHEGDPEDIYSAGVCKTCYDNDWRQCAKCEDHSRVEYGTWCSHTWYCDECADGACYGCGDHVGADNLDDEHLCTDCTDEEEP